MFHSLALLIASLALVACSSLKTATFSGPGDLANPEPPPPRGQEVFEPVGPFQLEWPIHQVKINQKFSPNKNRSHQGLDLGGAKGTPIFASHEGIVIYAGKQFKGYGKMVIVEYNNEWASLYAHLNSILVREGQKVQAGHTIGTMGKTGRATGVHLHFELLHFKQPIDPILYLPRRNQLVSN